MKLFFFICAHRLLPVGVVSQCMVGVACVLHSAVSQSQTQQSVTERINNNKNRAAQLQDY